MAAIELDDRWTITGHLNGGYLAAVCGQAASEALDGATPLSISTHYLAAARGGGPADVEVEVLRRGRLSTARVRLLREGTLLLESLVTAGTPAPDPRALEHARRPDVPSWEDCVDSGASEFAAPAGDGGAAARRAAARPGPGPGDRRRSGARARASSTGTLAYRDGSAADTFLVAAAWDLLPPTPWFVHIWNALPTVAAQVVLYPGELVGPRSCSKRAARRSATASPTRPRGSGTPTAGSWRARARPPSSIPG